MNRLIAVLLCLFAGMATAGEAIIDTRTGRLISGADADTPRFPASTTKLMTIYVALEAVRRGEIGINDLIVVEKHAAAAPPVKLGLSAGQTITLAQAIHAALIISSNDAARVIAQAVSGSEAAFADRMTDTARALGLNDTVFRNASGLPDAGHVSTAADIATLIWRVDQHHGAYLRPLFRQGLKWRGQILRPRNNTVASLPDAKLGKTGYTCAAGYTAAVIIDGTQGDFAIATLANSATKARAVSLARLAKGQALTKDFSPPCVSAHHVERAAKAPPALGDWSLTLGVFSDRRAAKAALRDSRRVIGKADRVIAFRPNGRGFYAVMLADDRQQAEKLRKRLIRNGVSANLIDGNGRRALGLRIHSRL